MLSLLLVTLCKINEYFARVQFSARLFLSFFSHCTIPIPVPPVFSKMLASKAQGRKGPRMAKRDEEVGKAGVFGWVQLLLIVKRRIKKKVVRGGGERKQREK